MGKRAVIRGISEHLREIELAESSSTRGINPSVAPVHLLVRWLVPGSRPHRPLWAFLGYAGGVGSRRAVPRPVDGSSQIPSPPILDSRPTSRVGASGLCHLPRAMSATAPPTLKSESALRVPAPAA